jgi:hypothetical protein
VGGGHIDLHHRVGAGRGRGCVSGAYLRTFVTNCVEVDASSDIGTRPN